MTQFCSPLFQLLILWVRKALVRWSNWMEFTSPELEKPRITIWSLYTISSTLEQHKTMNCDAICLVVDALFVSASSEPHNFKTPEAHRFLFAASAKEEFTMGYCGSGVGWGDSLQFLPVFSRASVARLVHHLSDLSCFFWFILGFTFLFREISHSYYIYYQIYFLSFCCYM